MTDSTAMAMAAVPVTGLTATRRMNVWTVVFSSIGSSTTARLPSLLQRSTALMNADPRPPGRPAESSSMPVTSIPNRLFMKSR